MKTREFTCKEHIMVIEKYVLGWSYRQIREALGISKATAYWIMNCWYDENHVNNKQRPGRPKKLSECNGY
ncbi:hypothetical protein L873DRAFT_1810092 [Choiromyces venosus 120613-1]|uniref:Transposase IS30-like HTH domain-containing protein n=1 Tax=Choiromyces venosus 120613-1 TaxID=1336337 RepID=A0A3N4JG75_9PEZI|nr:hypothetical protein L873DRAFT_1810092 [Choiromyces venosus 120613-1]